MWGSPWLTSFFESLEQNRYIGAFIAGIFFTSVFTTAPAIMILVKIAEFNSVPLVAMMGAAGAVIGDSIIFYFFRDRLFTDIAKVIKLPRLKRLKHITRSKMIRLSVAMVGGLMLAIPLFPDETAIAMMGFSKISTRVFIMIAFFFNFISILLLSLGAKYFSS
jgi:uncharacterized membrane protein YdjX (TVP38/TMEM64 family)